MTETLSGCEVDRIEAAERLDREACRVVEWPVVEPHEFQAFDDLMRAGDRRGTVMPDRSKHLNARESAGRSGRPSPQECTERRRLRLADDELHER